jgi:hypothetical protein
MRSNWEYGVALIVWGGCIEEGCKYDPEAVSLEYGSVIIKFLLVIVIVVSKKFCV